MNALTTEIKTRARLLLKLLQTNNVAATKHALLLSRQHNWTLPETWQLRHCLNLAAADVGFQHWEHARAVLGGDVQTEDVKPDFGDFWHGKEVSGYTNHWYASYAEAQLQLQADPASYLLPYRLQFIVVKAEYLHALGVSTDAAIGGNQSQTILFLVMALQAGSRYRNSDFKLTVSNVLTWSGMHGKRCWI